MEVMVNIDYELTQCIEIIKEKCEPFVIYIFGSVARNEMKQDSDVDIAFLTYKEISAYETFMIAQELADILKREVDLVNLMESSTVFKAQVVGTSKVIFCIDEYRRMNFEMRALKEYAFLNEEREPILKRIKEEGTVYGEGYYI